MRRQQHSFVSLKSTLITPYVTLILMLTLVIGLISYWAGSRMVATLSERLSLEMVERIGQAVDRHMFGSSAVLEAAFPKGMTAPKDITPIIDQMRTRFWTATTLHTDPNDYVYYGNTLGQSYGLKRLENNKAEVRIKLDPRKPREYFSFSGINGQQSYVKTEDAVFDPRIRPWFTSGQQREQQNHTWTAVYVDFATSDLVVTRARKVLSDSGQLSGVVATDVSLIKLNQFIADLKVSENGLAFLVESSGELLASSNTINVRQLPSGMMQRITVSDAGEPRIKLAYDHIVPLLKKESSKNTGSLTLSTENETLDLAYKHIIDTAGLDWTAIIIVPRSDILAGVTKQVFMVGLLGVIAVLIAIGLGFRILNRVASDVSSLSRAVMDADHSEDTLPATLSRKDEIGVLARSFMDMRKGLFTDQLTNVANRAALERHLTKLTAPAKQGETKVPFTLLFIDLDNFKPLNDLFGHDNGDLALIEVAQRFKTLLGPDDLLARYGGDEFVAVLREQNHRTHIDKIKQRFNDVLLAPLNTLHDIPPGENVYVTASIGDSKFPAHGQDIESLLRRADKVMYQYKKVNKNRY